MVDANALVIPTRIESRKRSDGHVNRYNLLKLAGAGDAVAETLEFAIDNLLRRETEKCLVNLNLSVQVAVYPRDGLRDPDDARAIRSDTLSRLASETNKQLKARLIINDPGTFQLAPDGRPVVLEAWPIPGGHPTVNIATLFPRSKAGPCVEIVTIPMNYIVDQEMSLQNQYVVYCHTITPSLFDEKSNANGMNYIGITKQGWRKRFAQHLSNAAAGSPLLFHRALRDHYRLSRVCVHYILTVTEDEKSAMDAEEEFVRGTNDPDVLGRFTGIETFAAGTLYPKGLNMIPGGYEGLRVLHKLGALQHDRAVDIDRREENLIKVMRQGEREGKANPLLASLWLDEAYATKIICGTEGRLNQIRLLGHGF
jgi:hypothetical protein